MCSKKIATQHVPQPSSASVTSISGNGNRKVTVQVLASSKLVPVHAVN